MASIHQEIPLSQLIVSRRNVRRTDRQQGVKQLAASIAAHGLLQNLTVCRAKQSDQFEVLAGGRRFVALRLLARCGKFAADAPVPCRVIADDLPEEVSLAENVMQCPMHPADQYEAFARLHDRHGMGARDIAARFGLSVALVRQRLGLGAVSPILMAAYRADDMDFDQLSAFTITDDHARQEEVWNNLPRWDRSRAAILRALGEGTIAADDRRARFVGLDAYEKAGGTIIRDLFENDNAFLTDPALLDELVRGKLERLASEIAAEGWHWVEIMPELDYGILASMRRVYPEPVEPSAEDQARLEALEEQYEALSEGGDSDLSDDEVAIAALEQEIARLTPQERFLPEQMASAGVVIALGHNGAPRIERGLVRHGEAQAASDGETSDHTRPVRERGGLPDKLLSELTACRTAALRNELAERPELALASVVHALAASVFYPFSTNPSCLTISGREVVLQSHTASEFMEGRALQAITARHQAWAAKMPEDSADLWRVILGLGQAEQLALLAHCASLTLDAVQNRAGKREAGSDHADALANELALDMVGYWQPTSAGYFSRVSKSVILDAVTEAVSPHAAENMAGMKKSDMAAMAEQRLAGKSWLPPILRKVTATETPVVNIAVLEAAA